MHNSTNAYASLPTSKTWHLPSSYTFHNQAQLYSFQLISMLSVFYNHTFIITSSSTYYSMLLHLTENDFSSKMNTWKEDSASHLKWVVTLFRIPAAEIRLADVTSGDKTAGNNSIWILDLTLSFREGPIVILQQKLLGNSTWPHTNSDKDRFSAPKFIL